MEYSKVFLLCFLLAAIQMVFVACIQYEVGDKSNGWAVPKGKDDYNTWASGKRFKVNDTLSFGYKKNADSVMMVTEAEYEKCEFDKPIFNSSDGESVVKLDRSGPFYFISGISAHCEKGQKMIVKVLGSTSAPVIESPPPSQPGNKNAPPPADTEPKNAPPPTQTIDNNIAPSPGNVDTVTSTPPAQDGDGKKSNAVAVHSAAGVTFTIALVSFLGVLFF